MRNLGSDPVFTFYVNLVAVFAISVNVLAQSSVARPDQPGLPAAVVPSVLREVGFDQHPNQQIPPDLQFMDEDGHPVRLGDYFGQRPVVLSLVYYGCPMLCTQTLNSLASTVGVLSEEPGRDFEIVTVSFDPKEKPDLARMKKAGYIERAGKPQIARGWHFLTGEQPAIDALTRAAGFRYVWDDSMQQFAHPTGIVVLTPGGRIARYLFGIDYGPRDLRLAVIDASNNKVSTPIQRALLYCYHYDLTTGRYSLAVMRLVQIAGAGTVLLMGTLILVYVRREHRRRH